MVKKRNRITAFFAFFFTLISLIPLQMTFNTEEAEAAVTYRDIGVYSLSDRVPTPAKEKSENEYEFEYGKKNIFIGVEKAKKKEDAELEPGESTVVDQQVIIQGVNGVDLSTATDYTTLNNKLETTLGCTLDISGASNQTEAANKFGSHTLSVGSEQRVGINIQGLSYGVNVISYKIKETTRRKASDDSGKVEQFEEIEPQGRNETITIYHGTKYLSRAIKYVESISYIGATKDEFNRTNKKDNKIPFKYNDRADEVEGYPLKYIFNVPDSTRTLDYVINFESSVSGTGSLLLNGKPVASSTQGNTISGSFTDIFQAATLVIKFQNSFDQQNLIKSYALEINCNQLGNNDDYTLRESGLTKLEYDSEDDVIAYIGKEITRIPEESVLTYETDLYIDPRAKMISIDPQLGVDKDKLEYRYKGDPGYFKDGKSYVDFSGLNKVIILEGFGKVNGSTDFSKVIVRYRFNVIKEGNGDLTELKLDFGNTGYLTQPGREIKIPFDEERYTYDMYNEDRVTVALKAPETHKNEYIRVWFGNKTDSTQLIEAKESVVNMNKRPGEKKDNTISNIDVGEYEKMIVRAYYDKIEYEDSVIKSITPQQIGHEYVFYIKKNIENSGNDNEVSSDAKLKDLFVEEGKLVDNEENKGFSPNVNIYNVTVSKNSTSAEITAMSNTKVHEITAIIDETGDQYDIESGKSIKLPLNDEDKTTIKIEVTATDKVTKKTYTLIINKDDRGSDCTLENIIVDPGDYEFDEDKKTTDVRVEIDDSKVDITPIPTDGKSKIYIDDSKLVGASKRISLKGEQEVEVKIEVVSEDGTSSRIYYVNIVRRDADDVTDTDNDEDESDVFYDEYNECWVNTSKYQEWGRIKGRDVYFDKRGRQVKNSWITMSKYGDNTYYYLNNKGYKQTGWLLDSSGKKYFLDQTNGSMKTGWLHIGNNSYYLDINGAMHTGWLYDSSDNRWQYFLTTGQMVKNTSMAIDGKQYNFGLDGKTY